MTSIWTSCFKALDARRELTEPAVGYTVRRDVVAVSLWVEAGSEMAAWELVNNTLVEEMGQLGLLSLATWRRQGGRSRGGRLCPRASHP
jgi:hypothetical protein